MPIDVDLLNQVRAAIVDDSITVDIKQCINDDKFKVEGDLLYFEECLYILKGSARL